MALLVRDCHALHQNIGVLNCPSYNGQQGYHYGCNYNYVFSNFEVDSAWPPERGDTLSVLTKPAETVMFVDSKHTYSRFDPGVANSNGTWYGEVDGRHMDGTNVAWCEGTWRG